MDKLRMESPDLTAQNIDRIAALFPNCITEMLDEEHSTPEKKVYKRAVNFELLKQMLSPDVVDGDEAYEFTWVGKKAAIVEANKPIRKTLRPCMAESKDWDNTENLYIEGDNLEVLKLLQESYLGKVKMIYIDPPYNTGNDFIYADDFMRSQEEENEQMGMYDEDENRLFKNTDTNGRFHSDWCSMIYSRLLLSRNLLREDGGIFISIDDNEIENLKKMCDEIYGSDNFVAQITVVVKPEGRRYGAFAKAHEFILVYAKNIVQLQFNEIEVEGSEYRYYDNLGGFNLKGLRNRNVQAFNSTNRPNLRYPFFVDLAHPDNNGLFPVTPVEMAGWERVEASTVDGLKSVWRWGKDKAQSQCYDLIAYKGNDDQIRIFQKERKLTQTPKTLWEGKEYISNKGTKELADLLGKGIFDFPKPLELIKNIIAIGSSDSDIVLDFFSGSATTAHAVMQLNAEDGGHHKFIMVQLPEPCDEASEACKAGYKTICEIGKERIRRAGEKLLQDVTSGRGNSKGEGWGCGMPVTPEERAFAIKNILDIGFRVLKLDDTNMKDVYYAPDDYDQGMLAGLESNIKDDRTDLDLLFGCLIDWGLPLSLPYKSEQLGGCTVHTYNDGDLIACFDANIPESVVKEIAQRKPLRAVFRDSGFASSPEKINVFEIFKLYMPEDANDISKRVRVI